MSDHRITTMLYMVGLNEEGKLVYMPNKEILNKADTKLLHNLVYMNDKITIAFADELKRKRKTR